MASTITGESASEGIFDAFTSRRAKRDRPLLTPEGRKIRHIIGIYVRNLVLSPANKHHTRSTDDESLAGTWQSPSKMLAESIDHERNLTHSRSSQDLVSAAAVAAAAAATAPLEVLGSTSTPGSPKQSRSKGKEKAAPEEEGSPVAGGQRRRRSTRADLFRFPGSDKPNASQQKLEEAILGSLADSFFTLHHPSLKDDPIYISEVVSRCIDPSYRLFELDECAPSTLRLNSVTVRVWAKKIIEPDYRLHMELDIGLSSLQWIGKSLEIFRHPLPENCIVFQLTDGFYTSFNDLPPHIAANGSAKLKNSVWGIPTANETASYDAIMKINNLEECIYDAENIRTKMEQNIEKIISKNEKRINLISECTLKKLDVKRITKAVSHEKKRLEAATRQREIMKKDIESRRNLIASGRDAQHESRKHLSAAKQTLHQNLSTLESVKLSMTAQRRRIIDDLQKIYPIEHISGEPLNFSICGQPLPNESFENQNEDVIGAALGYVAHAVYMLQFYLGVYLRYPVHARGSTSYIVDPISIIQGSRIFPLWTKGSIFYRFEYGVFLLNKNIEQLMSSQGCVVLELRHTLPNLKYLLYVATAGTAPMAERERPSSPFRLPLMPRSVKKTTSAISSAGSDSSTDSLATAIAVPMMKSASNTGSIGPGSYGSQTSFTNLKRALKNSRS